MNIENFTPYLSPLVTLVIGVITVIMTKNNLKITQETQEKINTQRINADIITKSRIAWIQDVRGQAAETLESYIKYMDAHNSNDQNRAFVSYYNYVKQLDILRLYFPKENLLETYNFELSSLRKSWNLNSDYSKLPIESPTRKLFMDMIYPGSKGNIDRNNYINDYAQELKKISFPFDTLEKARRKEISYKEIARNLSANQYYLNLLIEVIGNYLKLEWEVAKNFEPIKENL